MVSSIVLYRKKQKTPIVAKDLVYAVIVLKRGKKVHGDGKSRGWREEVERGDMM